MTKIKQWMTSLEILNISVTVKYHRIYLMNTVSMLLI